ncbi:MAG: hypothetical protein AAF250_15145 [Pseudomonadota bacterium]
MARLLTTIGIIVLGLSLQGCVAAAIPMIAGGALLRTGTDGEEPGDAERAEAQRQTSLAAQARLAEMADTPVDRTGEVIVGGDLTNFAEGSAYADLINYAREHAGGAPDGALPRSAVLRDPTALDGERADCNAATPTLLIDLDPGETAIVTGDDVTAAPSLANGLAMLREQGIEITWISTRSAADADQIRAALTQTGLDPESKDRLLLMRYPGDRKQTRRDDLAKSGCIIAIAGDTRKDFDELFGYLVNPEAALGLELLIGDGWFLVPPVLNTPPSQTALSTDRKHIP